MVVVVVVGVCGETVVIVVMVVEEVFSLVVDHASLVSQVRGLSIVSMSCFLHKESTHGHFSMPVSKMVLPVVM